MGVFCDRLEFGSTAALDCHTGLNKGRYCEKELLLLLVSLDKFNTKKTVRCHDNVSLNSRCPVGSTDQTNPACFFFRIS